MHLACFYLTSNLKHTIFRYDYKTCVQLTQVNLWVSQIIATIDKDDCPDTPWFAPYQLI